MSIPDPPRAGRLADALGMDRPNVARMYDYFLGGALNFDPDRQAADQVLAVAPQIRTAARANRAFLARVVAYAHSRGISQFLDLGSGLPTVGNVHELVHARDRSGRVVYVDLDPIAVAHAQKLLLNTPTVAAIQADLRDTGQVLDHHATRRLIDHTQPVAVLAVSVLHFVDGDPASVLRAYQVPAAPGSLLAISHATPLARAAQADPVQRLYQQTRTPLRLRSPGQIRALFGPWPLVHPAGPTIGDEPADLVPVTHWRPDQPSVLDEPTSPFVTGLLAGVAVKEYR